eukprot:11609115-Alexandrium_andersonii.AAC.1
MSCPTTADWAALQSLARYLPHLPRAVYSFPWRRGDQCLTVYADADLWGAHMIKHWSTTQRTIALSSGEAELAGTVKGAAEGVGLVSVARDLGVETGLR